MYILIQLIYCYSEFISNTKEKQSKKKQKEKKHKKEMSDSDGKLL